jgi:hypothetical protein
MAVFGEALTAFSPEGKIPAWNQATGRPLTRVNSLDFSARS